MRYPVVILVIAAIFITPVDAAANTATNSHVEDFTSTVYRDPVATNAEWDTTLGQVRLPAFSLAQVGIYNTPGEARNVFLSGDLAFVPDFASGLQIIDISNPGAPTLTGSYNTSGQALDVFVAGDHAFLADDGQGLQIFDITNPASPSLVGSYNTSGASRGVFVEGNHAYIGDGGAGLRIIDITDPTSPSLVGTYDTPVNSWRLCVDGDHCFVADGGSGLLIIDVTDPTSPTLAGSYDTPGAAYDVCVALDFAFVADWDSGLQVIDVSDPTNPTLLGALAFNTARGVAVVGDYAYVSSQDGVRVIDVSTPTAPVELDYFPTTGLARGAAVAGEHAFVADGASGLRVLKAAESVAPVFNATVDVSGDAEHVATRGDYAFVAANGLAIADISDPAAPVFVTNFPLQLNNASAYDLVIAGNYAYVSFSFSFSTGIEAIDISDPTNPVSPGAFAVETFPGAQFGMDVEGDYLYVANYLDGLTVIDISLPYLPTVVANWDSTTPHTTRNVSVQGDIAYLSVGGGGGRVVDVSDPLNPFQIGSWPAVGSVNDLAVAGDLMFVADNDLVVFDVSNPSSPTQIGSTTLTGNPNEILHIGDLVYLAQPPTGLEVVDVSDPTNPTSVATMAVGVGGVDQAGDHVIMADAFEGITSVRVFNRTYVTSNNVARSLAVTAGDTTESIRRVRLTTTETSFVNWSVSGNGGTMWDPVYQDGNWHTLSTSPGTDLVWQADLTLTDYSAPPTVSDLALEWLYDFAFIKSIEDVPNDQGGWARLTFMRSTRDFDFEMPQVESYNIYRRIADAALLSLIGETAGNESSKFDPAFRDIEGAEYVMLGDRRFLTNAPPGFPPGTWEVVSSVNALQTDQYVALVPTVADSAEVFEHSTYLITAHTTNPSQWYASPPDSGYSLDNIAPGVPQGFAAAYNTGSGNQLSWDPSEAEDFQYFRIYRDTDPNFTPSPANLVDGTIQTSWADPDYDGWNVHYKLTALDYVGNESPPATVGSASAVDDGAPPSQAALYQNEPNPFNPTTTIHYDVPAAGGSVTLRVFDVSGRLIRTLVDEHQSPGAKSVIWHGANDRGNSVSSGIYFYRMTAPGFSSTRKMVLLQ